MTSPLPTAHSRVEIWFIDSLKELALPIQFSLGELPYGDGIKGDVGCEVTWKSGKLYDMVKRDNVGASSFKLFASFDLLLAMFGS